MGSLALRPGNSLTILKMASSIGFRIFSFLPSCYSSYWALTLTQVGLTPTDHASLRWTHTSRSLSVRFRERGLPEGMVDPGTWSY